MRYVFAITYWMMTVCVLFLLYLWWDAFLSEYRISIIIMRGMAEVYLLGATVHLILLVGVVGIVWWMRREKNDY